MRRWGVISLSLLTILTLAFFITSCSKTKKNADKAPQIEHATLREEVFINNYEVRVVPRTVTYPTMLPILSLKDDVPPDKEILGWFKPKMISKLPDIDFNNVAKEPFKYKYGPIYHQGWSISGDETGTVFVYYGMVGFQQPTSFGSYTLPGLDELKTISETEAIAAADQYIKTHGGIPADIAGKLAVPNCTGATKEKINGRWITDIGVLGYTIRYTQEFNGIPLNSEYIAVDVQKLKTGRFLIAKYSRNWHKVIAKNSAQEIISPEQAIEVAVKHFAPRIRAKSGIVASRLELVYYYPVSHNLQSSYRPGNELRPGWKVRVTGWDAIVDAYTGEIQGDEWGPYLGFTSIKAMQKFENEPLSTKIPVPTRITLIKNSKAVRYWSLDDRQFGAILHEAQNVLSKMRPYYKRKADMHGASGDTPFTYPKGGLLLEYGRSNAFLTTDSKLGRDMDPKNFPRDGSCGMELTRDGYYRIYGSEAFICFNESRVDNAKRSEYNKQLYGDNPFTKILINVGGPRYMFTDAVASNDKIKDLVSSYANAEPNTDREGSKK